MITLLFIIAGHLFLNVQFGLRGYITCILIFIYNIINVTYILFARFEVFKYTYCLDIHIMY